MKSKSFIFLVLHFIANVRRRLGWVWLNKNADEVDDDEAHVFVWCPLVSLVCGRCDCFCPC